MGNSSGLATAFSVFLIICLFGLPAQGALYSGGGSPGDPYIIDTAAKMNDIGANPGHWWNHFLLTADIDLVAYTGTSFNIIGNAGAPFIGVFDGDGHTISNFTYTSTGTDHIGLFGYVEYTAAEIKNLGLINPNVDAGTGNKVGSLVGWLVNGAITDCSSVGGSVSGYDSVGGLVGYHSYGTVSSSYATGNVSGGSYRVGGLIGFSNWIVSDSYATGSVSGTSIVGGLMGSSGHGGQVSNSYATGSVLGTGDSVGGLLGFLDTRDIWGYAIVTNSYATGNVSGWRNVGGLVGGNGGTVSNSYATGSVLGTGDYVGGLVGYNYQEYYLGGRVRNCYAAGSVSGDDYVGGLVGYNRSDGISGGYVYMSYSTGSVSGTNWVGGLVGHDYDGGSRVMGSYWDTQTSGQASSDGGTGKTTAEMQTKSTFFGWDFATIWTMTCEGWYPRLWWEPEAYGGGSGTEGDPYLIYSACQMQAIGADSDDWDKHFKLMVDIDLGTYTGTSFNIIGNSSTKFTGVFDGDGHTISNFTYNSTGTGGIGLFGYVYPNAEIKNLGLINPNVDAGTGNNVGSLVGRLVIGTVNGCYAEGGSVSGDQYVGGLVGWFSSGTVSNSYATGSVSGDQRVGGLVGYNSSGTVSNSYATGSVSGTDDYVGGLLGKNWNGGTVSECYATGSVSGWDYVGGLVGENDEGSTVSECYATGSVSGTGNWYVGGLVGRNYDSTVSNSYAMGIVSGTAYVGGLVGRNHDSTVSDSYAAGDVSGNSRVGGLLGWNTFGSTVSNSYATGSVSGTDYVGGLVGNNNSSTVNNSYSAGEVNGVTDVGGLIGYDDTGSYTKSFWDSTVNPALNGIGNGSDPDVIGESTANMQTESTFTDAGWDFTTPIWTMICEGWDYPRLWWEPVVYGGGSGTEGDPYLIYTACQMQTIGANSNDWDKHFKLMADIDLVAYTGTSFNIIAPDTDHISFGHQGTKFSGVFDGNGHTVSNFTYSTFYPSMGGNYIALFGYIDDSEAEIKNLRLIDPDVDAGTGDYVGTLVGQIENGTITGCSAEGGSVSGDRLVGGLVGLNSGTVSNSYATGSVSGDDDVGGLVGYNDGTVSSSYATGSVSGTNFNNDYVGGLLGFNSGTVSSSYAAGSVSGDDYVGGLVGFSSGTVSNSYATGSISGDYHVGGLVGYGNTGSYTKSFWDSTVNPGLGGIGNGSDPDVIGESTANMQTLSTFTGAGWDFVGEVINGANDIWDICEGTNYPKLAWQIPLLGDFVCPDGVDFIDFAVLALAWGSEQGDGNWNPDCDISEPKDNVIDTLDLAAFSYNWLGGL